MAKIILDTCKYLIKLDELRFKELVRNPKLNGIKSAYFSSDKKVVRRPIHIGSGIYIETNMSANSIRNLIL